MKSFEQIACKSVNDLGDEVLKVNKGAEVDNFIVNGYFWGTGASLTKFVNRFIGFLLEEMAFMDDSQLGQQTVNILNGPSAVEKRKFQSGPRPKYLVQV